MKYLYIFIVVRQWGEKTAGVVAHDPNEAVSAARLELGPSVYNTDIREIFAVSIDEPDGVRFKHECDNPNYEG